MAFKTTAGLALLALAGSVKAQSVDGSKYNSPTNGPPASYFAAATTLPVTALQSAAAKASSVPSKATYPVNTDKNSPKSTIHSDWVKFNQVCCNLPRTGGRTLANDYRVPLSAG